MSREVFVHKKAEYAERMLSYKEDKGKRCETKRKKENRRKRKSSTSASSEMSIGVPLRETIWAAAAAATPFAFTSSAEVLGWTWAVAKASIKVE
jgi:hypothetical protein